jgi:hypothetical protein
LIRGERILPEDFDKMSERELLLRWGFKSHHIIEDPNGGITINYEAVRCDLAKDAETKLKEQMDPD